MALVPYGEVWRRGRKLLHAHFQPSVSPKYHSVQLTAARRLARDVLAAKRDKEVLPALIRANIGRTIIKIVYGIDVDDEESEYISLPEQVMELFDKMTQPGRYLVDLFPICEY
jgi:cytochrome P450